MALGHLEWLPVLVKLFFWFVELTIFFHKTRETVLTLLFVQSYIFLTINLFSCLHLIWIFITSYFLLGFSPVNNLITGAWLPSSNTSRLEAHVGFFIAYEGDFWSLHTVTFWQKVDFLISNEH